MGETHEKTNKDYLAKKIAEEIAKKILKVNIYGYDLWKGYSIQVKKPTPYQEWPYVVCTPFELDIVKDMGSEAREVDVLSSTTCDYKISWDPGRIGDAWFPQTIPAGSTFTLEHKKISKLYFHCLTEGTLVLEVEGFTDC